MLVKVSTPEGVGFTTVSAASPVLALTAAFGETTEASLAAGSTAVGRAQIVVPFSDVVNPLRGLRSMAVVAAVPVVASTFGCFVSPGCSGVPGGSGSWLSSSTSSGCTEATASVAVVAVTGAWPGATSPTGAVDGALLGWHAVVRCPLTVHSVTAWLPAPSDTTTRTPWSPSPYEAGS